MKRIVCIILALILMLSACPAFAMLKYLDQYQDFCDFTKEEKYDDLIQAVHDFKTEHPLLMSDEWEQKIKNIVIQARDAFVPEFNSEYDPFEDKELKWFGDHKAAGPEDQCVILDNADGLILSFCIPVTPWIYIDEYTILVNGDTRFSSTVDNWDAKHFDGQACETFFISIEYLMKNIDVEQYDSVAIRFYGKNHDDHVDYVMDEETLGYFRQVTTETVDSREVNSVLWDWAKAVDEIVDETIMPAFATRMIRNNPVQIYPANIKTADYWTFNEELLKDVATGKWTFGYGGVYFFPCTVTSIHEPDEKDPYSYWSVDILSEYGSHLSSGTIILDYVKDGYIQETPAVGDTILVAAAYAGRGSWTTVFLLGYDEDTIKAARKFLK